VRMVAEAIKPQRPGILDQEPEDPATARELPDRTMGFGVDAGRDEALELLAAIVEDADGRIARARDLARDVEKLLQDGLDLELGSNQNPPRVDQAPEAGLVEDGLGHEVPGS